MKNIFLNTLGALFVIAVFLPWGLAISDAFFWGLFGNQITSIPWNESRGYFLLMWPVFVFFVLMLLNGGA